MTLLSVVSITGLIVINGLVMTCAVCMNRAQAYSIIRDLKNRVIDISPYIGIAVVILLLKQSTHEMRLHLSESLNWNITGWIFTLEGMFVAHVQQIIPDSLAFLFSVFYMFGYPYLLIVPLILYFSFPTLRILKELLVAYILNFIMGATFYTLFISHGPRIHLSQVEGMMYQMYPETQELTAAISSNANVFPSLHTSMSVVVLLFAWRTRESQPKWLVLATITTLGIVISTMFLGIHWLIDVLAGIVLAVWSYKVAIYLVSIPEGDMTLLPRDDMDDIYDGISSHSDD